MNVFKKAYCRTFQRVMWMAMPFLPYRNPVVKKHLEDISEIVAKEGVKKPFIITDKTLVSTIGMSTLLKALDDAGISYELFDGAFPNPTTKLAVDTSKIYIEKECDSIIAFGGGSPMDLAKAVGVCIARPKTPINKLGGILKVHSKLPLIVAIPTTAGTGSETTLAAVLIDEETHHKFAINDFPLIPRYTILDPVTIHSLPAGLAASTGLDALTHAVEAYIGKSTTRRTRADARKAVALIFKNLDGTVNHNSSKEEMNMLLASHYAGRAFTRSYVGYIHAVSHSLSGMYNLPHGWTNAVLLPIVLRKYGTTVEKRLAELARMAKLGTRLEAKADLAEQFIKAIEDMKAKYNIPDTIPQLVEDDIKQLSKYADKEANPLYPVPVLWNAKELEDIYRTVLEK